MKSKFIRFCVLVIVALGFRSAVSGYVYTSSNSSWAPGEIILKVKMNNSATLSDGSNYYTSFQSAASIWNAQMGVVQFHTQLVGVAAPAYDSNDIYFSDTIEGSAFGSGTLAVTLNYTSSSIKQIVESDIIFNTAYFNAPYTWDSYRGSRRADPDFRRVAIHELGHVLGLGHPDDNYQLAHAIMNSTISDVDTVTNDDIAGAQSLYRAPSNITPPANNDFTNAITITLSGGSTQETINSFYATKEPGEPDHDPGEGVGGASTWWKWTAPTSGDLTVTTEGSRYDTLLGVYTGSAVNALTLVVSNDDVDRGIIRYSSVSFNATYGTTYYFAVDGWDGQSGPTTLNLTFASTDSAPSFESGSPEAQTVEIGNTAQFSVIPSGIPAPTLQWQRKANGETLWENLTEGGQYSGTTSNTLRVQNTTTAQIGDRFRCIAENYLSIAYSHEAVLYVNGPPLITRQPSGLVTYPDETASLTVQASSISALTYQWYRNGVSLGSVGQSHTLAFNNAQSADSGSYYVVVTNSHSSVTSDTVTVSVNPLAAVLRAQSSTINMLFQRTDGSWWITGSNTIYVSPSGSPINLPKPLTAGHDLSFLSQRIVSAATGEEHFLFIMDDGSLLSYGSNTLGQLGSSGFPFGNVADDVVAISAGKYHSFFLKEDGSLWAMGQNIGGQLGDGTTINRDSPVQVATEVVSVSTFYQVTYFIKQDGSLWTIGNNNGGSLGDGTTIDRLSPVQVATGVRKVFAGQGNNFFIKNDGSLWGIGDNFFGQLGDGTTTAQHTPLQIATDVIDATSNSWSTLYVKTDGTLWAVGRNNIGQLLDNTTNDYTVPTQVATGIVGVATNASASFMIKADGSLWSAGNNQYHRLGIGSNADYVATLTKVAEGQITLLDTPTGLTATDNTLLGAVRLNWAITPAATHYEVWRSTSNDFGSASRIATYVENPIYYDLTSTSTTTYYYWVKAVNYTGISGASNSDAGGSLAATAPIITTQPAGDTVNLGDGTSFTIAANGNPAPTYQWQRQASGSSEWSYLAETEIYSGTTTATLQLSETTFHHNDSQFRCLVHNVAGTTISDTAILDVQLPPGVSAVAATSNRGFFLRYDGTLWTPNQSEDDLYQVTDSVALISASAEHYTFVKLDRTLWGVGDNNFGQLGDGTTIDRPTPVQITTDVVSVSTHEDHTLFLKSDGSLWAMGGNYYGQLLDGALTNQAVPQHVADNVMAIASGNSYSLFVQTDGTLWSIGNNSSGQLGDGSNITRKRPVLITTNVRIIAAGSSASFFIKNDATLWKMGNGESDPALIESDVIAVSAGFYHFVYLKSDHTLWGGDGNGYGQLGQGFNTPITTPVVLIDSNVATAVASTNATLFSKLDGTVWGTGNNVLGDGTNYHRYSTPTQSYAGRIPLPDTANSLTASLATTSGIRLTWHPAVGAISYDIYRHDSNNPSAATLIDRTSGQTIYHDNTATPGLNYYYWIKSINPAGASSFSNPTIGSSLTAEAPVITSQPGSPTISYGANTSLTVSATGIAAPTYQWQKYELSESVWIDLEPGTNYENTFSNQLTIIAPAAPETQFRCLVRNSVDTIISETGTVIVTNGPAAPAIQTQPQSQVVNIEDNASFTVVATGPSLDYQWQILDLNGTVWHNTGNLVVSGSHSPPTYAGVNSATLTVNKTQLLSGRQFRCRISNLAGIVYTIPATLTAVYPIPVITEQPLSQGILFGTAVELSVTATSEDPTISYQWRKDGNSLSGETASTFSIPDFQNDDIGDYTVVVTNSGGSVTSDPAIITIPLPPTITTDPVSQTVYVGSEATFSVSATSNTPAAYQWNKGGITISGATSATYTIPSIQLSDADDYTVTVTNLAGSVTSATATLTVNPAILPVITQQPSDRTVGPGAVTSFNVTATGEPAPTYQWQRSTNAGSSWNDLVDDSSVQGVHTAIITILSPASQSSNNGDQYRVVVANAAGSVTSNEVSLVVTADAAALHASGGSNHSIFLRLNGEAWGMGRNQEGQFGYGSLVQQNSPVSIISDIVSLSAGSEHSLFITRNGTLKGTGFNEFGALGNGTNAYATTPVSIASGVAEAIGTDRGSLFRKTDGTLWAMGWNVYGQLGDGTTTNRLTPVRISDHVTGMAAGYFQSLFVKTDGTLWAMGDNTYGQFGNGTGTSALTPVQVNTGVKQVSSGHYHTLILKQDNSLWATGLNNQGQLGDGTTTTVNTPVLVTTDVQAIETGALHSVFLKIDGTLWTMGHNARGQLGDDSTTNRSTPMQIDTQVTSITAGYYFTQYTKTDGTVWAMGANDQSQLGDGTTIDRHVPVPIASGGGGLPQAAAQPTATVSDSADRITLTWNHVIGASHYKIWRSATDDRSSAIRIADQITGNFHEDLTADSGVTYFYWIDAINPFGTQQGFSAQGRHGIIVVTAPVITTQPQPQAVSAGDSVTFSVAATSSAPMAYQWRLDGSTISGAMTSSYTIASASLSDAGDYDVIVTNSGGNTTSDEATLSVDLSPATVTLGDLSAIYDGNPHAATATTDPSGLTINFTYDGSATAPTEAGDYAVVGIIDDASYSGSSTDTLTIAEANQTITFAALADRGFSNSPITLTATASSGLPVSFGVQSGSATISGDQLTLTGTGTVIVRAIQAGNQNYLAAANVDRSFEVASSAQSWLSTHFTEAEINDELISGVQADPDGDGLTNLLEYALGLDPRSTDTTGLPEMSTTATEWVYSYTRPTDRDDITYEVEMSTDLSSWSTASITHEFVSTSGNTQTWKATVPLSSATNVFFHLKITQ